LISPHTFTLTLLWDQSLEILTLRTQSLWSDRSSCSWLASADSHLPLLVKIMILIVIFLFSTLILNACSFLPSRGMEQTALRSQNIGDTRWKVYAAMLSVQIFEIDRWEVAAKWENMKPHVQPCQQIAYSQHSYTLRQDQALEVTFGSGWLN
jgi:hypothetical protein